MKNDNNIIHTFKNVSIAQKSYLEGNGDTHIIIVKHIVMNLSF